MDFQKQKDFLLCIDSDGCAFDNMEIKWKECFIPTLIQSFGLQPISSFVRRLAEDINLYSKTRGINRFLGTVLLFDQLQGCDEVKEYDFPLPDHTPLKKWCEQTDELSNNSLQRAIEQTDDPFLKLTLAWSNATNRAIKELAHTPRPFPLVKESLARAAQVADIAVVSSANREAVLKEWTEFDLIDYTAILCSQDMGSKAECIKRLASFGYTKDNIIMLGDSLLDLKAAQDNQISFYPIIAGRENESWQTFHDSVLDAFLANQWPQTDQQKHIAAFHNVLK